jgi:hypothetical protein
MKKYTYSAVFHLEYEPPNGGKNKWMNDHETPKTNQRNTI